MFKDDTCPLLGKRDCGSLVVCCVEGSIGKNRDRGSLVVCCVDGSMEKRDSGTLVVCFVEVRVGIDGGHMQKPGPCSTWVDQ
jgi:hypothetical protein